MSNLFKGCLSLSSLPVISKWKIKKFTNMNSIFEGCSSLSSLPDISKWKYYNNIKMDNMIAQCENLLLSEEVLKLTGNKNTIIPTQSLFNKNNILVVIMYSWNKIIYIIYIT